MPLISPNFAVKSIIIPNFGQGPFPNIAGKSLGDLRPHDPLATGFVLLRKNGCHDHLYIIKNCFHSHRRYTCHITCRAQWLSGRVLDSRPRGSVFEPQQCHCLVVLEQDTFILAYM